MKGGYMQPTRDFETRCLQVKGDYLAVDGSLVRNLLSLQGGTMAHFELPAGKITNAVTHKTVDEIWFVLSGRGQMWRKMADQEEIVDMEAGVCLTIPQGTHFQWRSTSEEPLAAIGVCMPPWPGEDEAQIVTGIWKPTVP
jgi:mannose-6-phosphate isomerase-like protein (cupin superfamily)